MSAETELRDLVARLDQIQGLKQHPGWPLLADYVSAQIIAKNRALLSKAPATIEDVRWDAGWIVGAQSVLDAADQLARQVDLRRQQIEENRATA